MKKQEKKSARRLSRRQFLGRAAVGIAAVGTGAVPSVVVLSGQTPQVGGARNNAGPDQTLVLTNGRIHTLDARNTIARTVSIRNGRFVW